MGSSHFVRDIPTIIELYKCGLMRLDQLVSKVYPLSSIYEGFADTLAGRTIRGKARKLVPVTKSLPPEDVDADPYEGGAKTRTFSDEMCGPR